MRNPYFFSGVIKYIIINLLDKLEPLKGPLKETGYTIFNFNDYPELDSENDINKILEIVSKILSRKELLTSIKSYLKYPRLDQIRVLKSPLVDYSPQSEWHHDSVGHRIKVYIGLDTNITRKVFTEIISSSHKNIYFDYNNTRLVITEQEKKMKPVKIAIKKGMIFLFDTNMIHKGVYSKLKSRRVIELEFSSYLKGIILPGKIGRKKYSRPRNLLNNSSFRKTLSNRLKNYGLI